jgi:hypothetical protein
LPEIPPSAELQQAASLFGIVIARLHTASNSRH